MKIDIETKEFLKAINDFRTASRKKTGSVLMSTDMVASKMVLNF